MLFAAIKAIDAAFAPAEVPETAPPVLSFATPAEFEGFYDQWYDFVWRTARRLGAPDGSVDDVVQDVFVTVHRKHALFEGRGSVRAWLAGIVLRTVRRQFRTRSRRREQSLGETEIAGGVSPHASVEQQEMLALLYELLEPMDEARRTVFVMSEMEKMSAPEIAEATDTNVNTVYARIRAARQEFAERLRRHRAKERGRR